MRKCLPITLVLLAALSGQALGADAGSESKASGLRALVRLIQDEGSAGSEVHGRQATLSALAGSLPLEFWLGLPSLEAQASTPELPSLPVDLAPVKPLDSEPLLDQLRMRQPVSRGP